MNRVRLLVSLVVLCAVLGTAKMVVTPSAFADAEGSRCDCFHVWTWQYGVYKKIGEIITCVPEDCWLRLD